MFTISEIAKIFSNTKSAIRYYEENNLISPERNDSGYRIYSFKNLMELFYLTRYKKIGFTLRQTNDFFTSKNTNGPEKVLKIAEDLSKDLEKRKIEIEKSLSWLEDYKNDLYFICDKNEMIRKVTLPSYYYIRETDVSSLKKSEILVLSKWVDDIPNSTVLNRVDLEFKGDIDRGLAISSTCMEDSDYKDKFIKLESSDYIEIIIKSENENFSPKISKRIIEEYDKLKSKINIKSKIAYYSLLYSYSDEKKYYKVYFKI